MLGQSAVTRGSPLTQSQSQTRDAQLVPYVSRRCEQVHGRWRRETEFDRHSARPPATHLRASAMQDFEGLQKSSCWSTGYLKCMQSCRCTVLPQLLTRGFGSAGLQEPRQQPSSSRRPCICTFVRRCASLEGQERWRERARARERERGERCNYCASALGWHCHVLGRSSGSGPGVP